MSGSATSFALPTSVIVSRTRAFLPARGCVANLIVGALFDLSAGRLLRASRTVVIFHFIARRVATATPLVYCSSLVFNTHSDQKRLKNRANREPPAGAVLIYIQDAVVHPRQRISDPNKCCLPVNESERCTMWFFAKRTLTGEDTHGPQGRTPYNYVRIQVMLPRRMRPRCGRASRVLPASERITNRHEVVSCI